MLYSMQIQMCRCNHISVLFGILTANVSFLFPDNKNHQLRNYANYVKLKYLEQIRQHLS